MNIFSIIGYVLVGSGLICLVIDLFNYLSDKDTDKLTVVSMILNLSGLLSLMLSMILQLFQIK